GSKNPDRESGNSTGQVSVSSRRTVSRTDDREIHTAPYFWSVHQYVSGFLQYYVQTGGRQTAGFLQPKGFWTGFYRVPAAYRQYADRLFCGAWHRRYHHRGPSSGLAEPLWHRPVMPAGWISPRHPGRSGPS